MHRLFFVQPYRLKGTRLVAGAALTFDNREDAAAVGQRAARFRPGVVVLSQDLDFTTGYRGKPEVIALHGQVPDAWRDGPRARAAA